MPEEKPSPPYRMRRTSEVKLSRTPITHRDESIEHEYVVDVSPDLPRVRLKVFIFPNDEVRVEAEFEQLL